jgi:purine-binding chemotaxis protein CheW
MINNQSYLIFQLNKSLHAIEASVVTEIVWLPEITPIEEAPIDIVGVINLRGDILPIMDLNLRFGYPITDYALTDNVIIISWQGFRLGIIVNQVFEVENIRDEAIKKNLAYRQYPDAQIQESHYHYFTLGFAQIARDIVQIINVVNLVKYSEERVNLLSKNISIGEVDNSLEIQEKSGFLDKYGHHQRLLSPNIKPEDRKILHDRSQHLMQQNQTEDLTGFMPMAIVELNQEYFGINLTKIREFADIKKVTPVPGTPGHIIGNMNLRGEILTLVDIRSILNMSSGKITSKTKAMIVQVDDIVAGFVVDDVFDVVYLKNEEITKAPSGLQFDHNEYLCGTSPYREKMVSILDLPKILTHGELMVDDEV